MRIDGRESPVLSRGCVRVRWSTDRDAGREERWIAPCVAASAAAPDGQVLVDADAHARHAGAVRHVAQLAMHLELQPAMEVDALRMGFLERENGCALRTAHRR